MTQVEDDPWHRRKRLVNGRAKIARVYPPKLVQAMIRGVKKQMKADGEFRDVNSMAAGPSPDEDPALEDFEADYVPTFDGDRREERTFFVIRSQVFSLVLTLSMQLGRKNLKCKAPVYEKRALEECYRETGKPPIALRWTDRDKGDSER